MTFLLQFLNFVFRKQFKYFFPQNSHLNFEHIFPKLFLVQLLWGGGGGKQLVLEKVFSICIRFEFILAKKPVQMEPSLQVVSPSNVQRGHPFLLQQM